MQLMQVVQDDTVLVPGFERQTLMCSACGDIERRLVFTRHTAASHSEPVPSDTAPISQISKIENARSVARDIASRLFAKLCDVQRKVERLLFACYGKASRSNERQPVLLAPHTWASPVEPVSAPSLQIVPVPKTLLSPIKADSVPTPSPNPISPENENDLDVCESLLRRAIETMRGSRYSAQVTASVTDATAVSPAEPVDPARVENPSSRRVVVQIHYDPLKAKYVAKDTNSGLSFLRHQDRTHLQAMCDRMGWQVLDGAGD
jgi:hypothetical protein